MYNNVWFSCPSGSNTRIKPREQAGESDEDQSRFMFARCSFARWTLARWSPLGFCKGETRGKTEHLTANACISACNLEYQVEVTRGPDFDFDSTSGRAAPRILCGTWDSHVEHSSGMHPLYTSDFRQGVAWFYFATRRELLIRNIAATAVLLDICHNGVIFHKWVPLIHRSYRVTSNRGFWIFDLTDRVSWDTAIGNG